MPLRCEICYKNIEPLTKQMRQDHYEQHFDAAETPFDSKVANSSTSPGPPTQSSSSTLNPRATSWTPKNIFKEHDVFWYPSKDAVPPSNFTPGLIPLLRRSLISAHSRGVIRKAALCYNQAVFIQHETWDLTWGCGYRNFLMACACLMVHPSQPMYFPLLDDPLPPSIRNLQQWIEDAWNKGFDKEGKDQLKRLVGSKKWIGTSDLRVAFISRGIPAELVDFTDTSNIQTVINWIVNYFTPQETPARIQRNAFEQLTTTPVISTDKVPLILQHAGHSRSIIGYEVTKQGEVNLLVFDSGSRLPKEFRTHALALYSSDTTPNNLLKKRRLDVNKDVISTDRKKQRSASPDIEIIKNVPLESTTPAEYEDDETVITGSFSPQKGRQMIASSSKTESSRQPPEYRTVLRHFRLSPKKLGKNKQYQILYFPMTEPLTENEIRIRNVVTSTKVC